MNPNSGWPTSRRYPRTLGEAFKDAAYADPVYRPREPSRAERWGGYALAVSIGLAGAVLMVVWL